MERDQFTFYRSFWEALKVLQDEEKLPFIMAVCAYAFGDDTYQGAKAGQGYASFLLVKPILEKASKKASNGKTGGSKPKAKRKQTASKKDESEQKQTESKSGENKQKQTASYIEGEREKEGEIEVEGDTPLYPPAAASVVADYLNRVNPSASPNSLDELRAYAVEMGEAVCKRAFDIALDSKKATWPYIKAILRDKQAKGVRCLADWDALEETRARCKPAGGYDYSDTEGSL